MKQFGEMVPWGGTAQPAQIANVMRFMLSDEADFVCGSIFFVDGGSDAMLRSDDFFAGALSALRRSGFALADSMLPAIMSLSW